VTKTATAMLTVSGPATDAGVEELFKAAQAMHSAWFASKPAAPGAEHDVVKLHERLRAGSRSREVLELLPAESQGGLMPEELGKQMRRERDGSVVDKASARAAIRVVQRVTTRLRDKRVISGELVKIDWAKYDAEGAGRYSLSDEARKALDEHLKAV
jgi:hypothetical protein